MRSLIGTLVDKTPAPKISSRLNLNIPGSIRSDKEAQMSAMGSVGTLFAIVDRLCTSVAQPDWKLYRKPGVDGRRVTLDPAQVEIERIEVTRHAALDLWNSPNKFFTQGEFIETFQQHVDLTGEGWWVVSKAAGIPIGMWPVRPDRMTVVPDPKKFIAGYVYTGPNGEKVPLDVDEIVMLRKPNPLDIYRGLGPVQSVMVDLDSSRYAAEWNRNFFINSAEPGGIIEVDRTLDDNEFRTMRDRWREQHQGVAQAHRVAILEAGKWVDRKYTQKDMQFAELRQLSSETIREAFAFPKPMLGSVEDVNRANALAAEIIFARWLIVPRLDRIKWALNNDFLPMFGATGEGVEFDYVNPATAIYDRDADNAELTAKSNAAATLVQAGWDADEILRAVGLPPMDFKEPAKPVAPAPADPAQDDPAQQDTKTPKPTKGDA